MLLRPSPKPLLGPGERDHPLASATFATVDRCVRNRTSHSVRLSPAAKDRSPRRESCLLTARRAKLLYGRFDPGMLGACQDAGAPYRCSHIPTSDRDRACAEPFGNERPQCAVDGTPPILMLHAKSSKRTTGSPCQCDGRSGAVRLCGSRVLALWSADVAALPASPSK